MKSKVRGVAEASRNFSVMQDRPKGATLDQIIVESLEPIRNRVATSAPRPSLRRGVVTVKRSGSGASNRVYWVSFRGMALKIAHLVEFGTHPHSLAKGASRRKNLLQDKPPFHPGTPASPFMRPAFEGEKEKVLTTFGRRAFELIIAGIRAR